MLIKQDESMKWAFRPLFTNYLVNYLVNYLDNYLVNYLVNYLAKCVLITMAWPGYLTG